jgi:hypothetical protein
MCTSKKIWLIHILYDELLFLGFETEDLMMLEVWIGFSKWFAVKDFSHSKPQEQY